MATTLTLTLIGLALAYLLAAVEAIQ